MNSLHRAFALALFKWFDLAVMVCSFFVAAAVTRDGIHIVPLNEYLAIRIEARNVVLFLGMLLLWHYSFSAFSLYRSRRLSSSWQREVGDIAKAVSLGTLAIVAIALVFQIEIITPMFIAAFSMTTFTTTILSRALLRIGLRRIRVAGRNLRYVIIVGTNERAMESARLIESNPQLGYSVVGFVDQGWSGNDRVKETGYAIVSDFYGFQIFLRDHVVDEVMICAPIKSFYTQASRLIAQCEEQGISVRIHADVFTPTLGRRHRDHLGDLPMLNVNVGAMKGIAVDIKRLMDFSVSLCLLVILLPLFIIVALLIKLSLPGPIFFVQDRFGLNKRNFRLYKFRTMVSDAETKLAGLERLNEAKGPVFKMKKDPRVTPLGKWLRRTSLDELPQLLNVLKGDMSLVGPRPLPKRDCEGFEQDWHRRRFSVRPGITCLWQIGGRSTVSFDRWMELDIEYIDSWSLWLDIKILARTLPAVLKGSGAY
jgi:exopolysaccharide biosynthesis polyprenyl glycosylphosphotransferase